MSEPASFNYTTGVFHIAVTDPDPEALCERVIKAYVRKIGETVTPASCEGEEDKQYALYCQDPWRYVIEACSCNFEKIDGESGVERDMIYGIVIAPSIDIDTYSSLPLAAFFLSNAQFPPLK